MDHVYGVYFKGKLVYWSTEKKNCLKFIGKHRMSAFIDKIKLEDLERELDGARSQGSSRNYKTSDSS